MNQTDVCENIRSIAHSGRHKQNAEISHRHKCIRECRATFTHTCDRCGTFPLRNSNSKSIQYAGTIVSTWNSGACVTDYIFTNTHEGTCTYGIDSAIDAREFTVSLCTEVVYTHCRKSQKWMPLLRVRVVLMRNIRNHDFETHLSVSVATLQGRGHRVLHSSANKTLPFATSYNSCETIRVLFQSIQSARPSPLHTHYAILQGNLLCTPHSQRSHPPDPCPHMSARKHTHTYGKLLITRVEQIEHCPNIPLQYTSRKLPRIACVGAGVSVRHLCCSCTGALEMALCLPSSSRTWGEVEWRGIRGVHLRRSSPTFCRQDMRSGYRKIVRMVDFDLGQGMHVIGSFEFYAFRI